MDYLFQYFDEPHTKYKIDGIFRDWGVVSAPHIHEPYIQAALKLTVEIPDSPNGGVLFSFLNEFPGNCSSLILHHIESLVTSAYYSKLAGRLIWSSIHFSHLCGYSKLFITGAKYDISRALIDDYGFKLLMYFHNPHSGNKTYIVFKDTYQIPADEFTKARAAYLEIKE